MPTTFSIPDMTSTLQIRGFHINMVEPGWTFRSHHHPTFELLYCWHGRVIERFGEEPVSFQEGDWLLIPPGMRHSTENNSPSRFAYLSFLFDIDDPTFRVWLKKNAAGKFSQAEISSTYLPQHLKSVENLVQKCMIESDEQSENVRQTAISLSFSDKLLLQATVLMLIREMVSLRMKHPQQAAAVNGEATPHEVEAAHRMGEYINARLHESDMSIQKMAAHVCLSRVQCHKLFTKVYGMSPRQYMTMMRLKKAKELLIQTDLTIDAISEQSGFSSPGHFSRQFKRWTGVAPLHYRPKPTRL